MSDNLKKKINKLKQATITGLSLFYISELVNKASLKKFCFISAPVSSFPNQGSFRLCRSLSAPRLADLLCLLLALVLVATQVSVGSFKIDTSPLCRLL